jgi:hypothetical protein
LHPELCTIGYIGRGAQSPGEQERKTKSEENVPLDAASIIQDFVKMSNQILDCAWANPSRASYALSRRGPTFLEQYEQVGSEASVRFRQGVDDAKADKMWDGLNKDLCSSFSSCAEGIKGDICRERQNPPLLRTNSAAAKAEDSKKNLGFA